MEALSGSPPRATHIPRDTEQPRCQFQGQLGVGMEGQVVCLRARENPQEGFSGLPRPRQHGEGLGE